MTADRVKISLFQKIISYPTLQSGHSRSHMNNKKWTQPNVFIYLCKNIHRYVTIIFKEKEALNFRVGIDIGGLKGRVPGKYWTKKGRRKLCNSILIKNV